jgi:hypothetical protein
MLDSSIRRLFQEQDDFGGIDVSKLKIGTVVTVETQNNTYKLRVLGDRMVAVQGGRYFESEQERPFHGSTFGGSMLKMNWIGYDMRMEFGNGRGVITTSPVRTALVSGDGWSFDMEWPSRIARPRTSASGD